MRKIFLPLMLMIFVLTGCGGEKEDSKNISSVKHSKILVIGVDDKFAPMGFRDEQGNIVGFDIDLAKEAAKRLGVEVEFRSIDWDRKREELLSGNIDIIWNGLDIIDGYKEYMIFSKPYMENRQILLVKKGNPKNIQSLGDLEGKIVGTQVGSNSETYVLEDDALKNSFAEFKTCHDIGEGFAALNNGEFDAMIVDEIAARYEINKKPGTFEIVEARVGPMTEFGIGFRQKDTELRDKVQKVFNEMVKDGTAAKISEEWFQADLIVSKR